MVTLDAGPAGIRPPGAVCDVDDAEGSALVAGGFATVIEAPKKAGKPSKATKAEESTTESTESTDEPTTTDTTETGAP